MASHRRFSLPLFALAVVAGPLTAQTPRATPQLLANLKAQEGQRFQGAVSHVNAMRASLGLDDAHTFVMRTGHTDELGQTHARFTQHYRGLRVLGGEAITHMDAAGRQLPVTHTARTGIYITTDPNLTSSEAVAVAHQDLAPKGGYARKPEAELLIYPITATVAKAAARSGHLDATQMETQVTRYALAYQVDLALENGAEETVHMAYIVDAHTGAILAKWNNLHTSAAVGTGKSQWYGTVNLNTNSTSSGYEMRDMLRGTGGTFGNNVTTNLNHATSGNGTIYTDADNAWGDGNAYGSGTTTSTTGATGQTAAVDQHHGMASTWDFYKNVLGRNGIDGTGKAAYGRMHYSSNYDNAFWDDSCFCMTYGDGAPPSGSYGEADLDTVGHEMSHGVCATTANLTYSGESGGLNESNSDIFGTAVEFYVLGANGTGTVVPDNPGTGTVTANYTLFENSWGHAGQALRYMYKPSLDGSSPDAWSSSLGSLDVHYSSGPMNRCWYFLARGATTTGDTSTTYLPSGMTGVGNDHATRIWYRALTTYLTSSSNYAAARTAAINAAKDLYGAGSADEIAVWNAFHGINVGAAWSGSGSTAPAITGQPQSVTVAAGATATFTVTATGTSLTYQWRKNGTAISGATAASYTTPATTTADSGATFSVVVSNSLGSVTSSNATLTVTSTGGTTYNEVESNGTIATANAVADTVTKIVGYVGTSTDQDFFKVNVGAGKTLTVSMTGPSGKDYDLYLVNASGSTLKSSLGSTATESLSYKNSGTTTATYYIKVIGYSGAYTTSTAYNLTLTR